MKRLATPDELEGVCTTPRCEGDAMWRPARGFGRRGTQISSAQCEDRWVGLAGCLA